MKALKLSSNSDEKKQLKAQCTEMMSDADRIKKTEQWTSPLAPPPTRSKYEHIGHWAAEVAVSSGSDTAVQDGTTQSTLSRHESSSTVAFGERTRAASGISSTCFLVHHLFNPQAPFLQLHPAHKLSSNLQHCLLMFWKFFSQSIDQGHRLMYRSKNIQVPKLPTKLRISSMGS